MYTRKMTMATLLFCSVATLPIEMTRQLLAAGAQIDAKNNDGFTALHFAAANDRLDSVEELVERNTDIFARANDNSAPFDQGEQAGHAEIVQCLLDVCKRKMLERRGLDALHAVIGDISIGKVTTE